MTVQFRPMPWLTAIVAVMLIILIALGMWQLQRLQWKTALLDEIAASANAAPLQSLRELEQAIANEEPVDFRRIQLSAARLPEARLVFTSQTGGIYWRAFSPLRADGVIYAAIETLDSEEREAFQAAAQDTYVGYVRKSYEMGRMETIFKSQPNAVTNRWFKFDQSGDWLDGFTDARVISDYYIDVEPAATDAARLKPRVPDIRNNHRDYMLTWWSFALILLVFYAMIHRRAGRLSW